MTEFKKVLDAASLPAGKSTCVEIGGGRVALFNVGGTIHAIADECTHRGGSLSEGEVEGTTVTCPLHGAQFDLKTGTATGPPAQVPVRRYEVKVEGGQISLGVT